MWPMRRSRAAPTGSGAPASDHDGDRAPGVGPRPASGARIPVVHRLAATAFAVAIAVFGVLGFTGGLSFFATDGVTVAGLSTNGALSTVSVVTAIVLVAASLRGGRTASTAMLVIGTLFVVSAFANLAVLDTEANLFAFRLPNVFFSLAAGLLLLVLGAYGRVAGNLPTDNPYHRESADDDASHVQPRPRTADEADADRAMADAERAVARGGGTDRQRRRLAAADQLRWHEDRRRSWMDSSGPGTDASPPPGDDHR